ncbi:MAG: polyprenyl synthetase family protein, partial [Rickettsiales bacterium]
MTKKSSILSKQPATLDTMYALIGDDLKQVNALIIERVKNEIPLINDVVRHIVSSGGKRIRPALTLICSKLCNYNEKRHISLSAAV